MRISENDIRPYSLNEGRDQALARDLDYLASKQKQFVSVSCPACDGETAEPEFEKHGFSFVSCTRCQTVYMNPRAPEDVLIEFYKNSELYAYWDKYIFPASKEARREGIFRPRAEKVAELCNFYNVGTDVFIDIGAANGLMCEEVKRLNVFDRVIAVEPGKALAETCRSAGLETIEMPVEKLGQLGLNASVISCFEVIEHLYSPEKFLMQCKKLLKKKGLLVVSCPNFHGFDIQTLGVDSESLDAEHINLFNPESLQALFTRLDFDVLECITPGKLDADIVRNMVLKGALSLDNQPFLKRVLIDEWETHGERFQHFLQDSKLSSHMWLVTKPK